MSKETKQVVDPCVSLLKFQKELNQFQSLEGTFYKERGIILKWASFPRLIISFYTTKLVRALHVFTVQIDFTNYDLEPPSIIFVDPETKEPIKIEQLQAQLVRRVQSSEKKEESPTAVEEVSLATLIMAHKIDSKPFVCIPGVREYHRHPSHTDNPWLIHRGSGEGTLGFLLDKLYDYGTYAIIGYNSKAFATKNYKAGMKHFKFDKLPWTYDINLIPS